MNFTESLHLYLLHKKAIGLAISTLQNYERFVTNFFDFISENYQVDDVKKIDTVMVSTYIVSLSKRMKKVSVRDYFIAIKSLFGYLEHSNIISVNPFTNMKTPKKSRRIIPSFSPQDIKKILSAYDKNTFLGIRNYTIMATLFSTGIRKTELINLHLTNIFIDSNLITIVGKGDKERVIPLSPVYKKILLTYLRKRHNYIKERNERDTGFLFINNRCEKIGQGVIEKLFYDLRCDYSFSKTRVSAHTFRHTFAKTFILNGGDVFTLQKILGHEDITTTRIYIDLNKNEIKAQNDKFNPLDNPSWQYY